MPLDDFQGLWSSMAAEWHLHTHRYSGVAPLPEIFLNRHGFQAMRIMMMIAIMIARLLLGSS